MRKLVGDVFLAVLLVSIAPVVMYGFDAALVFGGALVACVLVATLLPIVRPQRVTGVQYTPALNEPYEDYGDDQRLADRAKSVFWDWMNSSPFRHFFKVRRAKVHRRYVARLTSRLGGRGFTWHSIPYAGPDKPKGSRIDTSALDVDMLPRDLLTLSRYIAECRTCGGDGGVQCLDCGGSKRTQCPSCNGEGNPDRMVNCTRCHGLGSVPCEGERCRSGALSCPICTGTGKLEEWLTVEGGTRNADVQIEPEGDFTRPFHWGKDGVMATPDEVQLDAAVVGRVTKDGPIDFDELPKKPDWGGRASWQRLQPKLQAEEAVGEQTFMLLEIVTVELMFGIWSVVFYGKRLLKPLVRPSEVSSRVPLRHSIALAAVPCAVFAAYLTRSEYFNNGYTFFAVCFAVLFAISGHLVFSYQKRLALAVAGLLATAAGTGALLVAYYGEPTPDTVREHIAQDHFAEASWQLHALGYPEDSSLQPLADELDAATLLDKHYCGDVTEQLAKIKTDGPFVRKARAHADIRALVVAEEAAKAGRNVDALNELACGSAELQASPRARELYALARRGEGKRFVAKGNVCVEGGDFRCAIENEKIALAFGIESDLRAKVLMRLRHDIDEAVDNARASKTPDSRVLHARLALDRWNYYTSLEQSPKPKALVALEVQLANDEKVIADRQAAAAKERKRQDDLAAQKSAAAASERQRKAEAEAQKLRKEREQFPPDASIACCDGTLSPSCTCGGPRAGCCEKHGGVCGCRL